MQFKMGPIFARTRTRVCVCTDTAVQMDWRVFCEHINYLTITFTPMVLILRVIWIRIDTQAIAANDAVYFQRENDVSACV